MSQSNHPDVRIGCPQCNGTVGASLPRGSGLSDADTPNRLRGTETECHNCGHELEFYYY